MYLAHHSVLCILASCLLGLAGRAECLTTASALRKAVRDGRFDGVPFELSGQAVSQCTPSIFHFALEDDSGSVIVQIEDRFPVASFRSGDRIQISGLTTTDMSYHAVCTNITVLGHGTLRSLEPISIRTALGGSCDHTRIRVQGTVLDAFMDEFDPNFFLIALGRSNDVIYVFGPATGTAPTALADLIGQDAAVEGICYSNLNDVRPHIKTYVEIAGLSAIRPSTPPATPTIPEITRLESMRPFEIFSQGKHHVEGTVLATWQEKNLLLKADSGKAFHVQLTKGPLPRGGRRVDCIGLPETDLCRVGLAHAVWSPVDKPSAPSGGEPRNVTVRSLLTDELGRPKLDYRQHASVVRLRGVVKALPNFLSDNGRLLLEHAGCLLPVDFSTCPDALRECSVDSEVEVVGVCIIETESWRPNLTFPHMTGMFIAVRNADDLRILSHPSSWTATRLLTVICSLLIILLTIIVWNVILRKTVTRRSAELKSEITARVSADLKVYERTRLAVELHDSVAQNLTGAALELRAARRSADALETQGDLLQHLNLAAKTLDSCRGELRNCLWDLRNLSLDNADMNDAIRQAILPHVGDARVAIRFNVAREHFSDNSAHVILRIIRELVINSIRHGKASAVRIAGSIEDNCLKFSVRDNGTGFDPVTCPGMEQGHFGLQGIRERVDEFEGTIEIESHPGKGAKTTITIRMPRNDKDEQDQS